MSVLKYKDPVTGEWKVSNAVVKVVGEGFSEPVIEPLTVTENGEYIPPEGVDGYAPVTVDVVPELEEITVTENGEYTPSKDGYSKVTVNVAGDDRAAQFDSYYSGGDSRDLTLLSTKIIDYAFSRNRILNLSLPNATEIGEQAFGNGNAKSNPLKTCSMPKVTKIGMYAFAYNTSLEMSSLPEGLTYVGGYAFYQCYKITASSLPDGLTYIGARAFYQCTRMTLSSLPDGLTSISSYAFINVNLGGMEALPEGLTSIDTQGLNGTALNVKVLPSALTSLSSKALGSNKLTNLTFKSTPSSIASDAFTTNNGLTTINVPWAEGEVANAPWGATNATINYNYDISQAREISFVVGISPAPSNSYKAWNGMTWAELVADSRYNADGLFSLDDNNQVFCTQTGAGIRVCRDSESYPEYGTDVIEEGYAYWNGNT